MQVDLHAAINVGRDLQHGNMHHLAHDAAHLKKGVQDFCDWRTTVAVRVARLPVSVSTTGLPVAADPNAPELPEAERLAKEQKKSNMKGAMQFLKV